MAHKSSDPSIRPNYSWSDPNISILVGSWVSGRKIYDRTATTESCLTTSIPRANILPDRLPYTNLREFHESPGSNFGKKIIPSGEKMPRLFDPWPVFFKREWNRNWPFLVGFAVTGTIITKLSLGLTGRRTPRIPSSSRGTRA
ncbi:unnamed protein product [Linum tenue]|uniref:Uncharacterized protein n=1 Tax=Linum tenue TaxID=586396 RepID=A0AAV0I8K9_9ROSI|nr:unnamed protein product [Linum tenue]